MKEDKNKVHPLQEEKNQTSQPEEGSGNPVSGPSFGKRLVGKKWLFPATYLAAAAIILALMWVYQDSVSTPVDQNDVGLNVIGEDSGETQDEDAVAVTADAETLGWPVQDSGSLEVTMSFFDVNNSNEDNQAAMVEYGDTFTPHYGIDLAGENNEVFDVLAAMSGTVTRVEQVPVIGQLIEIQHENGLSTVYSSVEQVQVAKGDKVTKGQSIAKSGRNELEKDLGNHVHFEVWDQGQPVNPENYIGQ